MGRTRMWAASIFGFAFAMGFGLWASSLFTKAESVHFSVNFPSDGRAEVMACCDLGGPWARDPEKYGDDHPAGGVLTWGREGEIVVDVGREGLIKRTIQPDFINLSSHWLRNVGTQPYRIGLQMDMCDIDLHWETFEANWDPATHTFTRFIDPGKVLNMDWYFTIPRESRNQGVICEGKLTVLDAETQSELTVLPVTIVNSRAE